MDSTIKFIIYRSSKEWRIRTISNNFISRLDLLSKEELLKILSKPEELEFVHNKLFIASTKTFDTALEIARKTLKQF
jgi:uncharacterized UPF0160 family protein